MKEIVYTAREFCPHCQKQIEIRLISEDLRSSEVSEVMKAEVKSQGMNSHWYAIHRVCAKCGELIASGDGDWALSSNIDWELSSTYVAWTHKSGLEVLDVHKWCTRDEYKVTNKTGN